MAIVINEVIEVIISENLDLGFANVTPKGLKFNGICYTNSIMLQLGWFEKSYRSGEWRTPIFYDATDESQIFVILSYQLDPAIKINIDEKNIDSEIREIYFEAVKVLKSRLIKHRRDQST